MTRATEVATPRRKGLCPTKRRPGRSAIALSCALTSVPELLELAVWDAVLVSEDEADVEPEAVCRGKQAGGSGLRERHTSECWVGAEILPCTAAEGGVRGPPGSSHTAAALAGSRPHRAAAAATAAN